MSFSAEVCFPRKTDDITKTRDCLIGDVDLQMSASNLQMIRMMIAAPLSNWIVTYY